MDNELIIRRPIENLKAIDFCMRFENDNVPRYIFGRNDLAKSIIDAIEIDGVIDDFTKETEFYGRPIVPIEDVPNNALVVVVVVGKPLLAEKRVSQFDFEHIDYFAFKKHTKLPVKNIMFWDNVTEEIERNLHKYKWIYHLLKDKTSKAQLANVLNFRYSHDLSYMRGFSAIEHLQYFEHFLPLSKNEVFYDIGAYDGYTTEQFINKCPDYHSIHCFEPEDQNMQKIKERLKGHDRVFFYQIGLSDKKGTFRFTINGSSSRIDEHGDTEIYLDKLDDIMPSPPTFIKIDIEGEERHAIEGAKNTIKTYHPKLAIAIYHKSDDIWHIPEQILSIKEDYEIYLRHYTEGISETIMFFIPKG